MAPATNTPDKQAFLEALDRVLAINLDPIRRKTEQKLGWDGLRAIKAELEYRRYLTLILLCPDQPIAPPSNDADEIWHSHILDTQAYQKDCQRLFGDYLHHVPSYGTPEEKRAMAAARHQSEALFQQRFGSRSRDSQTVKQVPAQGSASEPFCICMAASKSRAAETTQESFWTSLGKIKGTAQTVARIAFCNAAPAGQKKSRTAVSAARGSDEAALHVPRTQETAQADEGCVPCFGRSQKDQTEAATGCVPCFGSPQKTKKSSKTTKMVKIT
jgi:hypothetical protein